MDKAQSSPEDGGAGPYIVCLPAAAVLTGDVDLVENNQVDQSPDDGNEKHVNKIQQQIVSTLPEGKLDRENGGECGDASGQKEGAAARLCLKYAVSFKTFSGRALNEYQRLLYMQEAPAGHIRG